MATIVGFYGDKPEALQAHLSATQQGITDEFGSRFSPRPMEQIHSTIIGLSETVNGWATNTLDIEALTGFVAAEVRTDPLRIQFGGFDANSTTMLSRGLPLSQRMLSVQGNQVVEIGWPIDSAGRPCDRLGLLRKDCERYGFRHKYHTAQTTSLDNDAYMVIGELGVDIAGVGDRLTTLAGSILQEPSVVDLFSKDLNLVEYAGVSLARASSRWWSI